MLNRRQFLVVASAGVIEGSVSIDAALADGAVKVRRLVLVHGRDQQGQDPVALQAQWMAALKQGADRLGRSIPRGLEVVFPYYGDTLDRYAREFQIPTTVDVHTKGATPNDDFLSFEAEVADSLRQRAKIPDSAVDAEYGANPKAKGPLNWEWVQAILRALDKYGGGMSQEAIEIFLRDVFLYTYRVGVRDEIDHIVASQLTEAPAVVVGHSLGSVVTYNILRSDPRKLHVPLYVTVGCPLAIRAIRDEFLPLRYPQPVGAWYNAYDPRDVVALFPLDEANFPVMPEITNYGRVDNSTPNRHGIVGYLDDPVVAEHVLNALG